MKEVTGEDVVKRFERYQNFKSKQEAITQHAKASNAAVKRKAAAQALPHLLRIHELRGMGDPRFYGNAAFLLFHTGHEEAGDRAILDHADFCKSAGADEAYLGMHAIFIEHAYKCRNLLKAAPSAEVVLASKPDYLPALAVRMIRLGTEGRVTEAKQLARRILELEPNVKSPWRQMAEKALTMPQTRPGAPDDN